jgi:hypothetical protein
MGFALDPKTGLGMPSGAWKTEAEREFDKQQSGLISYYSKKSISLDKVKLLKPGECVLYFHIYKTDYSLVKTYDISERMITFQKESGDKIHTTFTDYTHLWFVIPIVGNKQAKEDFFNDIRNIY